MKVLQINSVCGTGSTGKIAVDIYNVLKNNGHECKIAYGRGEARGIAEADGIRIGSNMDMYIHVALTRLTDKTGFYSRRATRMFLKKVDEYKPDIIHLHNIHGYYINIELLFNYIKEKNIPVIWTLHDCWSFTGHCAGFEYCNCDKWRKKCQKCPQTKDYPKSLFDNSKWNYEKKRELFCGAECIHIVTPSVWLAKLVKKSFLDGYNVSVINNGIDRNIFKTTNGSFRQDNDLDEKKVVLAVTSNWERRKGIYDIIELSGRLSDEYKIVLVGNVVEGELPDSILHIERTGDQKELAEIYSAADVLINPTGYDNFPTVNIEALACGTPVITYKTGGSPEAIDETCGIVTKENNVDSLIEAIKALEAKNIQREACTERAKLFDKNARFAEYLDLYEKMESEKNA